MDQDDVMASYRPDGKVDCVCMYVCMYVCIYIYPIAHTYATLVLIGDG